MICFRNYNLMRIYFGWGCSRFWSILSINKFFLVFTCINVKSYFTVGLCFCPHTIITCLIFKTVSTISNAVTIKWVAPWFTSSKRNFPSWLVSLVLMRITVLFHYLGCTQSMRLIFHWAPAQQKIDNCLINVEWMPSRELIRYQIAIEWF